MKTIEESLEEIGINLPMDGFLNEQEDDCFVLTLWASQVSCHTAITAAYDLPGRVLSFTEYAAEEAIWNDEDSSDQEARFQIVFDPTFQI